MKIKRKSIGSKVLTRMGWLTIQEGKENLYKKLNLNVFEDESNERHDDGERSPKPTRKNNTRKPDLPN